MPGGGPPEWPTEESRSTVAAAAGDQDGCLRSVKKGMRSMSTTQVFITVEASERRQQHREDAWAVFIVRYADVWQPRTWRDVPPDDVRIGTQGMALAGVSRSIANCYLKAFNASELKRAKHHWACSVLFSG
jgi:hypothetical protein